MHQTSGKSWYEAYFKRRKYPRDNIWHGLATGPRADHGTGMNRCRITNAFNRMGKVLPTAPKRATARFLDVLWCL